MALLHGKGCGEREGFNNVLQYHFLDEMQLTKGPKLSMLVSATFMKFNFPVKILISSIVF